MDESIFDRQLDEQLCFRLYRASNGINKMYGRALKIFQLTFPQYLVLLALWDNDGLPITTIGSQVGMGIGTLNPILKRMTEHDWIEKKQHPTDKRTMLIFLSASSSHKAIKLLSGP
ncbi:MarR family winged helix-turn-helix transcriptional regulator, partial [Jeotgalibaca porci]|uniref:MarR family winged helix-turn-helix transcriptional regulator n=1 Tax=Jeotgalibaca porci TaxID=1868793 RepID=UPI00359F253E